MTKTDTLNFRDKPWGKVATVLATPDEALVEYLVIRAGGKSSEHRHCHHVNRFTVIEGTLEILLHDRECLIQLRAGETANIPPDVWHQFYSPTGATVIESYYFQEHPARSVEDDIERR